MLGTATAAGADVFVTSDLKHHAASDATEIGGPALCDVAHFASEWPWLPVAAGGATRRAGTGPAPLGADLTGANGAQT